MKRVILTILLGLSVSMTWPSALSAQQPAPGKQKAKARKKAANEARIAAEFGNVEGITAAQLKEYLYFVASDEMEGRNTPSRGLDLTAKFIALNLGRWGYQPAGTDGAFLQQFGLYSRQLLSEGTVAGVNGQNFKVGEDFLANVSNGSVSGALVYVSHGLVIKAKNINAYQGVDVKDKLMIVADAYPKGVKQNDLRGKIGEDYDTPGSYALSHGAKGIIIVPNSAALNFWKQRYENALRPTRPMPESPQAGGVPTITASVKMANTIFEGEKLNYEAIKKQMGDGVFTESFDLNPTRQASLTIAAKVDTIMTQNVVAILEGSDPELRKEYVAVGAHYDHVGNSPQSGCAPVNGDSICNGADDDGSGTVAILSMAEALARGPRPKRSILFVWHAGEEKGLWGSDFVTDNPPIPLTQIIAQLNIDMIGRSKKPGDSNPRNLNLSGPKEIYVIGSKMMSADLGKLSDDVNKSYLNLSFNYKYDDPNDRERLFYRSDHYNYARKGIPIIFYFDGVHEDYHRPTDHADKIDYEKMEQVTRTVFATMWKLANAPSRPKVDKTLAMPALGN